VVGIDLGTTNCALAWIDTAADDDRAPITVAPVPQLVNPHEAAARTLLPSFMYIPGEVDFPSGSLALPWDAQPAVVVGELARKRGAENPVRLVASAKSWLSHGAASRTTAILPWGAPAEVAKVSPVEASKPPRPTCGTCTTPGTMLPKGRSKSRRCSSRCRPPSTRRRACSRCARRRTPA
jgi:molecular chaperone DnaK (HSP70)